MADGMVHTHCKRRLLDVVRHTEGMGQHGFDPDYVSDPKSWRGPSPIIYSNPGPYSSLSRWGTTLAVRFLCG